jgi:lycopene beta-cyclase
MNICFLYLLPLSPYRALIEITVFEPRPVSPRDLEDELQRCIARNTLGGHYRELRSEYGTIPMGQKPFRQHADLSAVKVGLASGGARAASGFAFQRIQRWAEECAVSISERGSPTGHSKDPLILRFMDHLFLMVIKRQPRIASKLFLRLFGMKHSSSFVRFLNEQASVADCLAMIRALPPEPFLRELLNTNSLIHSLRYKKEHASN